MTGATGGVSVQAERHADWSVWRGGPPERSYSLGVEEEIMLLDSGDLSLAHRIDEVIAALPEELRTHVAAETHGCVLEIATGIQASVPAAARELRSLRGSLEQQLERLGLRAASAGTHPCAVWQEIAVSSGKRYQRVYGSMRELAKREPTLALHAHVGVSSADEAIMLVNRLRGHLPLLLALSVNSPFWQGRDTGLASARTPLFQAFPRVGIPRLFESYGEYVEAVDLLIRCDAFPEPTFLWWDVRPQPRLGTVEVRIMDAQTTVDETAVLLALVQSIARLEVEEGWVPQALLELPEVLDENRFLAARDGIDARLIDAAGERRVPARELLEDLLVACLPHARQLGCERELLAAPELAESSGAARQLEVARGPGGLSGLLAALADAFTAGRGVGLARLEGPPPSHP